MNRQGTGLASSITSSISNAILINSVTTAVSSIGQLGLAAFGTIRGLDLQEQQLELQEDIADRQLRLEEQARERELELLDLQIENSRASDAIDLEVKKAVADLQISQAGTLQLEEEFKRELAAIQFETDTGQAANIISENSIVQFDQPSNETVVNTRTNRTNSSGSGSSGSSSGLILVGVGIALLAVFTRKKERR